MRASEISVAPDHDRGLHRLRDWLRQRCGMDYPDHKILLLKSRLQGLTDRLKLANLDQLAEQALGNANSEVASLVVQVASTNHSFFYRETDVLGVITSTVLAELSSRNDLRIWSAAASSGEEAYTVAIMLAETLGLESARRRISILGTDISANVVAEAERGIYGHSKLENVDHALLQKYFKPVTPGQLAVSSEVKSLCTFRRLNLKARPWPFRRTFDVVLCRNVLYYFERPDQIATLEAIYEVTTPRGWLLTSVTETLRNLGTKWEQVQPGVYRRGP